MDFPLQKRAWSIYECPACKARFPCFTETFRAEYLMYCSVCGVPGVLRKIRELDQFEAKAYEEECDRRNAERPRMTRSEMDDRVERSRRCGG